MVKDSNDSQTLYNTACLFNLIGNKHQGLGTFRRSIEMGYRNIKLMKQFLIDEVDGIAELAGTPEYDEIKLIVEKIEAETNTNV